jgi:hypothetical protein
MEGVEAHGTLAGHHGATAVVVDMGGTRAPRPPPPPPCHGHPHECRREAYLDPSVAIQSPRHQLDQ